MAIKIQIKNSCLCLLPLKLTVILHLISLGVAWDDVNIHSSSCPLCYVLHVFDLHSTR